MNTRNKQTNQNDLPNTKELDQAIAEMLSKEQTGKLENNSSAIEEIRNNTQRLHQELFPEHGIFDKLQMLDQQQQMLSNQRRIDKQSVLYPQNPYFHQTHQNPYIHQTHQTHQTHQNMFAQPLSQASNINPEGNNYISERSITEYISNTKLIMLDESNKIYFIRDRLIRLIGFIKPMIKISKGEFSSSASKLEKMVASQFLNLETIYLELVKLEEILKG